MVESVFSQRRFVGLSKSDVPVLLLHPGLDGPTSLSDINLAALTGDAVHTWSLQSQTVLHRKAEAGIFLGGRPALLMLCLASILLMRLYVAWTYGTRATEVVLIELRRPRRWVTSTSYLLLAVRVLRNPPHRGRFPCHTRLLPCVPRQQERTLCWNDGDVIQGSGRGLCG